MNTTEIKQLSEDAVTKLMEALEHGEIAGPYWALLTHPVTDNRLVQQVFGDVHMLSHQVGAAAL